MGIWQSGNTSSGMQYLTKNTTGNLTAQDMQNSVISNYGQTEDIELTLPVAGAEMSMVFQYDHIGHDVVFKSGDGVIPIIDYVVKGAGFNFKKRSPLLGEIGVFRTVQIGADAWRWVVESGETLFASADVYEAKSVILDIADNWGDSQYLDIRAFELYYQEQILNILSTNITCYATNTFSSFTPNKAFDISLSKIGSNINGYASNIITNQRLICVFNELQTFDGVKIINGHNSGTTTTKGVKNTKIYISTDAITDTTYNASIPNSQLIFDGQFRQHVAQNIADPETLTLI